VSTRLEDMMTVFKISAPSVSSQGGAAQKILRREEIVPSPVTFPRSFALDPTGKWLVVAGQTDNRISVLKIDSGSGRLTPTMEQARVGSPVCVLFDSR
jgi:6-phosphogluconolactonase (cycloisomerase 2 family)